MTGTALAHDSVASARGVAFWEPRETTGETRTSDHSAGPHSSRDGVASSRVAPPRPPAETDRRHRGHSHHHSHHGEHGHRVRWRGRPKWPVYLKRSAAAMAVFAGLLAWFWLLIGSCDPPPVVP